MIVVQLRGGLGNQLFQYATGRALALRRNAGVHLDARLYRPNRSTRRYALDVFAIETVPLGRLTLPELRRGLADRFFARPPPRHDFRVFDERTLAFDPDVISLPDGCYLRGFFQSEQYFADAEPVLRGELEFNRLPNSTNSATIEAITAVQSVSIHLRRGDYVAHRRTSEVFGTPDLAYYNRAAEYVSVATGNTPTFFVFSDDHRWARANLRLPFPMRFIAHNGPEQAYEDLRLMSSCRHHIIANSTFSWWAAWLSRSPEKIVVAPRTWFADRTMDASTIVPPTWVRL